MEALSPDIVIGMKYLYSNMPYSDVGNYTFDTYLDYVQQGIYLWENSPYVKNYPELYFLNYVLFIGQMMKKSNHAVPISGKK